MALRVGTYLPSFEGATQWIHGEANESELRGHAVLIHFWAASCSACLHNMESLQRWKSDYEADGLRIVAIHLPRMSSDYDTELVKQAVEEYGISWPCAVDGERVLSEKFDTGKVWPYYFLFDAEGKMRSRAAGGVGLRLLENALHRAMGRTQPVAQDA